MVSTPVLSKCFVLIFNQAINIPASRYNIKGIYLKVSMVMVAVRGGSVGGWVVGGSGGATLFLT